MFTIYVHPRSAPSTCSPDLRHEDLLLEYENGNSNPRSSTFAVFLSMLLHTTTRTRVCGRTYFSTNKDRNLDAARLIALESLPIIDDAARTKMAMEMVQDR